MWQRVPSRALYMDVYRSADASLFAHRLCFWWCAALICCIAHPCHACAIDTTNFQEMPSSCAFDASCGANRCRICTGLLGSVVAGHMQCEVISGALTLGSKTLTWKYVQCRAARREATGQAIHQTMHETIWHDIERLCQVQKPPMDPADRSASACCCSLLLCASGVF